MQTSAVAREDSSLTMLNGTNGVSSITLLVLWYLLLRRMVFRRTVEYFKK